ncbi:MAG: LPP20 family lipoprotein [Ignavibacteriales bacterium]|nr:LPP20 family lipoprotein [Ignavibacteriales bacterium]
MKKLKMKNEKLKTIISNLKSVIVSFVICIFFIGSANAQIPSWYLERKLPQYSLDEFWIGVGSAKGTDNVAMEQATNNARKDIAAQFKVSVSSRISTLQSEMRIGDKSTLSSSIENKTTSVIDAVELVGLQTVKTEQLKNENQTYVLVALEKSVFRSYLKNALDMQVERVQSVLGTANAQASRAEVNAALNSYLATQSFTEEFFPDLFFYNGIADSFYRLPVELTSEEIDGKMKAYVSGISLSVIRGNKQSGETGKNLPLPLETKAILKIDGKDVPLKGVNIHYKLGNLTLEKVVTNDEGVARHTFLAQSEATSGGKGKVVAFVDIAGGGTSLRSFITKNTTCEFEFTLAQSAFLCAVEISGAGSLKIKDGLRKKIIQSLEKNGATITEDAPFLVKGTLALGNSSSTEGMGGILYTQEILLSIEISETKTNKIMGTLSVTAKGFSKNSAEAVEKGISNIKVPSKELGEAMAKARDGVK